MIYLKRPHWQTGEKQYVAVSESVIEEMCDIVLGPHWFDHVTDDRFEYRRRRWAQNLLVPDAPPYEPDAKTVATSGVDAALIANVRKRHEAGQSVSAIKAATGLTGAQVRAIVEPAPV